MVMSLLSSEEIGLFTTVSQPFCVQRSLGVEEWRDDTPVPRLNILHWISQFKLDLPDQRKKDSLHPEHKSNFSDLNLPAGSLLQNSLKQREPEPDARPRPCQEGRKRHTRHLHHSVR